MVLPQVALPSVTNKEQDKDRIGVTELLLTMLNFFFWGPQAVSTLLLVFTFRTSPLVVPR